MDLNMNDNKKGLVIDISLLAIVIALHMTNKDKNLQLVVMALLLAHLITTMSGITIGKKPDPVNPETSNLGSGQNNGSGTTRGDVITARETSTLDLNDDFEFVPKRERASSNGFLGTAEVNFETKEKPKVLPVPNLTKSVSDGGFNRSFSQPKQTSRTTVDVLPKSGSEANSKLADARTSFFERMINV